MDCREFRKVEPTLRKRKVKNGHVGWFWESRPSLEISSSPGVKLLLHPTSRELLCQEGPGQAGTYPSGVHQQLLSLCQWDCIHCCQHGVRPGDDGGPWGDGMTWHLHIQPQETHWLWSKRDSLTIETKLWVNQFPCWPLETNALAFRDLCCHSRPL